MRLGETLYEPGYRLNPVHFPATAIVSLFYVLESGASGAIAGPLARTDPAAPTDLGSNIRC
jgi:hypothetical protein